MEKTSMTSWDQFVNLQRRNPQRPEWTDKFEVSVQGGFDSLNVGWMGALQVGLGITVLHAFPWICGNMAWHGSFQKCGSRLLFWRAHEYSFGWSWSDNFQLSFKAKAWPWNGLTSWETRDLEAADGQSGRMVRGCSQLPGSCVQSWLVASSRCTHIIAFYKACCRVHAVAAPRCSANENSWIVQRQSSLLPLTLTTK